MKDTLKTFFCIVFLLTYSVLCSLGAPQEELNDDSFLDFEILDEQNKTCRLKVCVLKKTMGVVVPETVAISGKTYKLTTIGDRAFANYGCQIHLTQIILPPTITTIEESAFYNCDSLKEIIFPKSLTTIGRWAFYDCDGLEKVSFPDSVTNIGCAAFSHCDKLLVVTLPNSELEVEEFAFETSPLSHVFVPKLVKTIGMRAFDCNISVDNENPYFCSVDGVLFDRTKKKILSVPIDRKSYAIPKSVEIIGKGAFYCILHLSHVTIPNSLKTIEDLAFVGSDIKEVIIPNSVTSIGKKSFLKCRQLSIIAIPNSVEEIGDSAFFQCSSLTDITLPNSLKKINDGLFEMCRHLTSIEIPNSVTTIGANAFSRSGLTQISLPDSIVKIADWSFFDCYFLNQVTLPNSLLYIGEGAFSNCSNLKQIKIPSSVKTVRDRAFPRNCEIITK